MGRGASTITQQLIKNLFLSFDRNMSRKYSELIMTPIIEKMWGKKKILEIYLNLIELAPGIYGVGAAAKHYFNKDIEHVDLVEAAFLASMTPCPHLELTHPARHDAISAWLSDRITKIIYQMSYINAIPRSARPPAVAKIPGIVDNVLTR